MSVAFFHSRILFTFVLLFSFSLTACRQDEPAKLYTLESARADWAARGNASYTIDQQWSCECGPVVYGKVRITVQNNHITNVISLKDGQPVPQNQWDMFSTIEELFEQLEEFETRTPFRSTVQFTPKYGYPAAITVDYSGEVVDDEFAITTSGLTF